jgi:hypothetical protein
VDAWRTAGRDATGRQLHPVVMTSYFGGRLAAALVTNGDVDEAADRIDELLAGTPGDREPFWDVELLKLRAMVNGFRRAPPEVIRRDLEAAGRLAEKQGARGLAARLATGDPHELDTAAGRVRAP